MSMLSYPTATLAMTRNSGNWSITAAVNLSVNWLTTPCLSRSFSTSASGG
jgi:hypothetical protein